MDFDATFADIEGLVKEAAESGQPELLDIKAKDAHVKVLVER